MTSTVSLILFYQSSAIRGKDDTGMNPSLCPWFSEWEWIFDTCHVTPGVITSLLQVNFGCAYKNPIPNKQTVGLC